MKEISKTHDKFMTTVISLTNHSPFNDVTKYGEFDVTRIESYRSFVEDEQRYKLSDEYNKAKNYWMNKYEEIGDVEEIFPINNKKNECARIELEMDQQLAERVDEFISEYSVSPYCFFLSIIALYLNTMGNGKSVYIGTPLLNRHNK